MFKMSKISQLLALIVCCLLYDLGNGATCPYQQCICGKTYLICRDHQDHSGQDTSNPPTSAPPTVDVDLDLVINLPENSLPANLTEINLTDSPILIIPVDSFDKSASTLVTVSFTHCQLTHIPEAFLDLTALKYLIITDTNIHVWDEEVMLHIAPTVETLTLSNVGLTSWPSWMKHFSNLTELSVGNSLISIIPDDAFELMSNSLTTLTLDNNSLIAVPMSLTKLSQLQILYLQENKISNLTWLPSTSALSTLSLSSNNIHDSHHVSTALLPFTKSLLILELDKNKLTSLPNVSFLTNIGRLDFSYNRLSDSVSGSLPPDLYELNLENNFFPFIPFAISALKSLSTLDMTSNSVAAIRDSDFSPTITEVDLANNFITELTDTSFPVDCRVYSLLLDNNPIVNISQNAFRYLASLSSLSLINSKLTRLPLALSSLKSLSSVDLTGSRYLVCTCMEKVLERWVMSLIAEGVLGDCGQTSIYNFFATLSPGCPD